MRDINLPCALEHARGSDNKTILLHRAAIDKGGGIPGYEDENLGRVAEPIVTDGNPTDRVRRDVIEENQPEREAAEQIKPEIAFRRNRCHVRLFFRAGFRS